MCYTPCYSNSSFDFTWLEGDAVIVSILVSTPSLHPSAPRSCPKKGPSESDK